MSIHIMFTNGSNPYIRYNMDPKTFAREILKWSILYNLDHVKTTDGDILHFTATEKKPNPLTGT